MAFETLQPIRLNEAQKSIEEYLDGFEAEYPCILVEKVPIKDALTDMQEGKSYEV